MRVVRAINRESCFVSCFKLPKETFDTKLMLMRFLDGPGVEIYALLEEFERIANIRLSAELAKKRLMDESIHNANDEKMRRLRAEASMLTVQEIEPAYDRMNEIAGSLGMLGFDRMGLLWDAYRGAERNNGLRG